MSEVDLKEQNAQLRLELSRYTRDGLEGLYHALNYQLNCLSDELRGNYISFTTKNDKTFERIWKAMVDSKDVAQNMQWLQKELKIKKDGQQQQADGGDSDSDEKLIGNPIEKAAFERGGGGRLS